MKIRIITYICCLLIGGTTCKQNQYNNIIVKKNIPITIPIFNADSAYHYTSIQTAFGPRVPGTQAHIACGNYLIDELRHFGAKIIEQNTTLYTYNKRSIPVKNIIASFNLNNPSRILLCAHWDSRPFADNDPILNNHIKAIDGANDGAGACGILLEIARQINICQPAIGIDIVLFDAEDYGTPTFDLIKYGNTGWCLGSTYWAKYPHVKNYTAQYGILIDMVSAVGAQFYKEYFSSQYAENIVNKVWETAQTLGYSEIFINKQGAPIQDDHVEVFKYRHIPCIDIIHYDPTSATGFGNYWHTLDDTMEKVSRKTMKAVGQTIVYTIYNISSHI